MKKLLSSIVGGALGLALVAGIGTSLAVGSKVDYKEADAAGETTVTRNSSTALTTTATAINNDNHVTIKTSSSNTYTNPCRLYANTTITIASQNGARLVSVVYEASSTGDYVTNAQNATVTPSTTPTVNSKKITWSLSTNPTAFTIKPSAQTRWNSIAVTYTTSGGAAPTHAGTAADPYTVVDAMIAIDANTGLTNAHTSGKISKIESYDQSHKSITYWISDDGTTTKQLQVYSGKGLNNADFTAASNIKVGASVTVCGTLKKYNSTYEYDYNNYMVAYNEEGIDDPDLIPEPAITKKSIADFKNGQNTMSVAYLVTGTITQFNSGSTKNEYGNLTLSDGTNTLRVNGSTIHTTALAWNEVSGEYVFTNPKKFLTDEETNNLAINDTITMILVRKDYNNSVQAVGVIILTCSGYSKVFLQSMTCDATGVNAPVFANTWAELKTMFQALPSDQQSELVSYVANENGNVLGQAMARYDLLVAKYGYENFIGRAVSSPANRMNLAVDSNTTIIVITVVSVISAATLAAYFILRKKKEA